MLGKTHKVGGVCTGAVTSALLIKHTNLSEQALLLVPVILLTATIGSLLPDIDHPNSILGRRFKPISHIVNKLFGHRGATHTLMAWIVVTIALFGGNLFLPESLQPLGMAGVLGTSTGYLNHLLLDSLTPAGIPLMAPFNRKKFRLARIPTGKYEGPVSIAIIAVSLFFLYLILTIV